MLITFFTKQAEKLYPRRWWFLLVSLMGMGVIFLTFFIGTAKSIIPIVLLEPVIIGCWALLCMCTWFHPTKGNLNTHSKIMSKLPKPVQTFIRWYSALLLAIFFAFGLIVFPLFGLLAAGLSISS